MVEEKKLPKCLHREMSNIIRVSKGLEPMPPMSTPWPLAEPYTEKEGLSFSTGFWNFFSLKWVNELC